MSVLSQKRLKELLTYDPKTGHFYWKERPVRCKQDATWNSAWANGIAGTKSHGYVAVCVNYRIYRAHRLAFLYMNGKFPKNDVDHRNGDRSDNRWVNLREATRSQNLANGRHKNPDRGVRQTTGGNWQARIAINGKAIGIGTFATKAEALAAYKKAAIGQFGDFAIRRTS